MYTTRQDVTTAITEAIEANGSDVAAATGYDLDQIADRAYEYSPELGGFVQTADTEDFWTIVQEAAL